MIIFLLFPFFLCSYLVAQVLLSSLHLGLFHRLVYISHRTGCVLLDYYSRCLGFTICGNVAQIAWNSD